jgi:TetR/AcrR family transcriptional regulator, tetracycline repressor protein
MDTVLPILRHLVKTRHTDRVTTTPRQRKPARRSPGRPPVPLDRIVETALKIVDEDGADALSMRTLAQRLNSGTATLYRHFANRSDLVAQVIDRVFGDVEYDTAQNGSQSWQETCKSFARKTFDVLRHHPNVAPLLVERIPIGPNAMAGREHIIALLLDSGFEPELAARSYATVARHVLGFAIQLTTPAGAGQTETDDATASNQFHGVNPAEFPATIRVADHMPVPLEEEFEFGLELIINGLTQMQRRDTCRRGAGARSN